MYAEASILYTGNDANSFQLQLWQEKLHNAIGAFVLCIEHVSLISSTFLLNWILIQNWSSLHTCILAHVHVHTSLGSAKPVATDQAPVSTDFF